MASKTCAEALAALDNHSVSIHEPGLAKTGYSKSEGSL